MGVAQGAELVLRGEQRGRGLLGAVGKPAELDLVFGKPGTTGQECQQERGDEWRYAQDLFTSPQFCHRLEHGRIHGGERFHPE